MTKQQAVELGNAGIRVNCVAPGRVETAMAQQVHSVDIRTSYRDAIPLNQYGTVDEIAVVLVQRGRELHQWPDAGGRRRVRRVGCRAAELAEPRVTARDRGASSGAIPRAICHSAHFSRPLRTGGIIPWRCGLACGRFARSRGSECRLHGGGDMSKGQFARPRHTANGARLVSALLVLAATLCQVDSASAQLFQWTPEQLIKYERESVRPLS